MKTRAKGHELRQIRFPFPLPSETRHMSIVLLDSRSRQFCRLQRSTYCEFQCFIAAAISPTHPNPSTLYPQFHGVSANFRLP